MEFTGKPVLCACRSDKGMEELLGKSRAASSEKQFLLLLDYDGTPKDRVLPAYMNALVRQKDRISRSRSVRMEMLLLVSGTMNIGRAIRERGAKDPKKFLAFATSEALLRRFAEKNGIEMGKRIRLTLDESAAGSVALTEIENG